jgi:hypothetical protein
VPQRFAPGETRPVRRAHQAADPSNTSPKKLSFAFDMGGKLPQVTIIAALPREQAVPHKAHSDQGFQFPITQGSSRECRMARDTPVHPEAPRTLPAAQDAAFDMARRPVGRHRPG